MSLINDALKKAQRQRHDVQAATAAGETAGEPIEKRGRPMSAQLLIVLAAGGVVLIVVSAVITVFFINRGAAAPIPPIVAKPAPAAIANTPSPVIVAPAPTATPKASVKPALPPKENAAPASLARATPPPAAEPIPVAAVPSAEASVQSAPPPAAAAPEPPGPDPHIQSFVDSLRVAGIRSSGSDSKVLMNDRVYRLNDTVEPGLGLKLVKVTPDAISFSDAHGVIYVKHF